MERFRWSVASLPWEKAESINLLLDAGWEPYAATDWKLHLRVRTPVIDEDAADAG